MITSTERSAGDASMASVESMSVADLVRRRLDPDDPWELALVQRHLVWDEVRMARLLDSLLAGYPIGSLLVCRVQLGGHVLRDTGATRLAIEVGAGAWQLLDGQQRINTLVSLFTSAGRFGRFLLDMTVPRKTDGVVTRRRAKRAATEYIVWRSDDEGSADELPGRERYLDLSRWQRWAEDLGVEGVGALSVSEMAPEDMVRTLNDIDPAFVDELDDSAMAIARDRFGRLIRVWTDLSIPVQYLTLDGPTDVLQVFSRINLEGVRLDGEDVFFAAVKTLWPDAEQNLDRVASASALVNRVTALRLLARLASYIVVGSDLLPLRVDRLNGDRGQRIIDTMRLLAGDGSEALTRIGVLGRLLTTESGLGYGLQGVSSELFDHVFGWSAVHPQGADERYVREQLPDIAAYLFGAQAFRYPTVFLDAFARLGFTEALSAGVAGQPFPLRGIAIGAHATWPELRRGLRRVQSDATDDDHLALADANAGLFLSVAERLPYELPVRDADDPRLGRRSVEWDHIYAQARANLMRVRHSDTRYLVHHVDRRLVFSAGNLWALDRPINNRARDISPSAKLDLLERLPADGLPSRWPPSDQAFLSPSERSDLLEAESRLESADVEGAMVSFGRYARGRGLRLRAHVIERFPNAVLFAPGASIGEGAYTAPIVGDVASALGRDDLARLAIEPAAAVVDADEAPNIESVVRVAEAAGVEAELVAVIRAARQLGLGLRGYKSSLMVTPPGMRNRMLFTVHPQAGDVGSFSIYRWAPAISEFYPAITEEQAREALGPDGFGSLPRSDVAVFIDRLRHLFAGQVAGSSVPVPSLSWDDIRRLAGEYLRTADPERRGVRVDVIAAGIAGRITSTDRAGSVYSALNSFGERFERVAPRTFALRTAALGDEAVGSRGAAESET
jgi:Protein of unknown function DUF262